MKSLKYFFHSPICRIPTYILSSHRRHMASVENTSQMETNIPAEVKPEIGPSAPELQLNNLTGDHERK